ncbi:ketol-acid reductoisomerase [Sphingomonas ginkgonis]|nr:ketol-acid reductoisomerase [Sphingomonas ginkgonis]
MIREDQIDAAPLSGKRVAIIGYGNQGRAQALNLRDSGIDVVVGQRAGSAAIPRAREDGLMVVAPVEAVADADLAMLLVPDEHLPALYRELEPALSPGRAIGFSHGLAVHFGLLTPRPDLDVLMIAPKGPGTALRSLYRDGKGMIALVAVHQDASGRARALALAYAKALGCGRAGIIESSFEEECVSDLFNEQAVVWGAVPDILVAGWQTLVAAGISEEVAYLECVSELKLLAGLIEDRGLAGMREAISNTAELGAALGGPRIVDEGVRERMAAILASVRSGAFTDELQRERDSDYARLRERRKGDRASPLEAARTRLFPSG